jgi:hypothetical protein
MSLPRTIAVALALPPSLALAGMLAIALAERAGAVLFGEALPRNLAEATAMGRGDDVVRRLRLGEDVRRVYPVRPDVTHSPLTRATATEAAIWSRQRLMIELLDRAGAIEEGDRQDLGCLAADLDLEEIVEYLAPAGTASCVPERARERVLARAGSR